MRGAGGKHRFEVHLVAGPAQQLAAGHVPENGGEGICHGANDARGLSLAIEIEAAVHAGHDEIEAPQDFERIIERPIRQDVGFDAFEDAK